MRPNKDEIIEGNIELTLDDWLTLQETLKESIEIDRNQLDSLNKRSRFFEEKDYSLIIEHYQIVIENKTNILRKIIFYENKLDV